MKYTIEACEEAIKAIRYNYPPENYTMLREALDISISLLTDKMLMLELIELKEESEVCE